MEGLGNDFVVLEGDALEPDLIPLLCDRRRGVGADGVLVVDPRPAMRYWNADGSPAEMCGNGLRCVARYAVEAGWAPAGEWMTVDTAVGPRRARVDDELVTVEVGPVELGGLLDIGGRSYRQASIGNPHAVTLVDDPDGVDVAGEGRLVAGDAAFPAGANVEFVALEGPGRIRLRVWERGVGETQACGSGIVVAGAVAGNGEPVEVSVRGGSARVYFEEGSGFLVGPARRVFDGEWPPVSAGGAAR